ncbi:unnamed protein product [Clonostachys rosea f. rosea IK726]|uniref:Uncharacterized protein n=1 Tax=Clonostachys rosea f. rosea IK726 TaxID=1349383 RepID=A0ACA9UD37_BIOOC|nr:unnamed protein product [Clonostachys rosea f. rosea IK726]
MSGQDAVTHPVWRIYFPGTPRDHVAIFIQTETAMIGTLIQVRGAIERPSGMRHEKLDIYNLSESRSLRRKERLGNTKEDVECQFGRDGPLPGEKRRCNEWQADYEKKLSQEGLVVDIQKNVQPLVAKYTEWY